MLDRTRDARCNVQLRCHDLACLAHLQVVGGVACIHRCTAGTNRCTQLVGQRGHDFVEFLGAAQCTATRDDDLGCSQLGAVVLGNFTAHKGALARVGNCCSGFHRRCAARGSRCVKASAAYGDDFGGIRRLHGGNGVASVNGALEGVCRDDGCDVADLANVQLGGHARSDVLAAGCGWEQDVAVVACNSQHLGREVFCQAVFEAGTISVDDFGNSCDLGCRSGGCSRVFTGDQYVHITTAGYSGSDGVQGSAFDGGVVVFCDYERSHFNSKNSLRFLRSLRIGKRPSNSHAPKSGTAS
ncbi:hypothetical protein D3C78_919920 [compost metagenome]